jgi:hypothetical protein
VGDQVIFVGTVRGPEKIDIVLENVKPMGSPLFNHEFAGTLDKFLDQPVAGFLIQDKVSDGAAFGGGIFGMAATVNVEAAAVSQEFTGPGYAFVIQGAKEERDETLKIFQ